MESPPEAWTTLTLPECDTPNQAMMPREVVATCSVPDLALTGQNPVAASSNRGPEYRPTKSSSLPAQSACSAASTRPQSSILGHAAPYCPWGVALLYKSCAALLPLHETCAATLPPAHEACAAAPASCLPRPCVPWLSPCG